MMSAIRADNVPKINGEQKIKVFKKGFTLFKDN